MVFTLPVPKSDDPNFTVNLPIGEILFVLGPNGVGKSRLMQGFFKKYSKQAQRLSAQRQNFFSDNGVSITPADRIASSENFRTSDADHRGAWYEWNAEGRINATIYDLFAAENDRARRVTEAIDDGHLEQAISLSNEEKSPIKVINELLRLSNLPIVISITKEGAIWASKSNGPKYGINQLSDGERNALIIISSVLTAGKGALILIDEPERHLHHSISSPLLSLLIAKRPDCAIVVSTHDIMLAIDNRKSNVLLLRGCIFNGETVKSWDADVLPSNVEIDEKTKEDILGSRRKMLYIEGTSQSLDMPLYSLVFPEISIVAKKTCREVEKFVTTIRQEKNAHWVSPFGIIDNDGRSQADIDRLKTQGIYALPYYSVEAIYYHPEIQRRIAERQACVTGGNETAYFEQAQNAALDKIWRNVTHLSQKIAEKAVREDVFRNLPNKASIQAGTPVAINIDVAAAIKNEEARLNGFLAANDFLSILKRYPIRESGALGAIATNLQFVSRDSYERAVIKLLMDVEDALNFVKSLFGTLPTDIG